MAIPSCLQPFWVRKVKGVRWGLCHFGTPFALFLQGTCRPLEEQTMRHLPKFSDDYGFADNGLAEVAILSADLEDMVDAMGDDLSLAEAEEVDLDFAH